MTEFITILVPVASATATVVSAIVATIKGRSKRKAFKDKSEVEQRNDLHKHMVETCSTKETFSKMLKTQMSKDELSKWKHSEVLRELGLYAKAAQYTWYNNDEWSNNITEYVKSANATAGKVTK